MQPPEKIAAESVRASIMDSFATTKYPGDARLVTLDPDEDSDSGEIFERLQNQSWQGLLSHLEEIGGPELYWYCWIYSMLTPEAFYYYLPAFLIISMDLRRADTVGTHLIYALSENASGVFKDNLDQVIPLLSAQQRMAMQQWTRYLYQEYPGDLRDGELQYWLQA